jgi:hypothetical protein
MVKRIGPAAAGLAVIFVTGALGTPLASATLPEVGRCAAVEGAIEGNKTVYHGAYTNRGCTTSSATKTGKYEWTSGVGAGKNFTLASAKVKLQQGYQGVAPYRQTIECHRSTIVGEYTGPASVSATAKLEECERHEAVFDSCQELDEAPGCNNGGSHDVCQSEGSATGEIRIASLVGQFGFITPGEKPVVGLWLRPAEEGAHFADFHCGATATSLRGSVIGELMPIDKMTTSAKLMFRGEFGGQEPQGFEGGVGDQLSLDYRFERPIALITHYVLSNEEPLELRGLIHP